MNKRFLIVVFALLLAACAVGSSSAVQRRRAERFGAVSTPAQVATSAPTSTPTVVVEHVAGDVRGAVGADHDGDARTQLISVALVVIFGIPTFWAVSLRKVRSHNGQS